MDRIISITGGNTNKFYYFASNYTKIQATEKKDPINVYSQFYIDKKEERYNEIKYTLKKNVENNSIDNIFLLNERQYTTEELGIESDKIHQIIIGKRLEYQDFFEYSKTHQGYLVFVNSDIYFDDTIQNLYYSGIDQKKICYCLCRHEDDGNLHYDKASFKLANYRQREWGWDLSKLTHGKIIFGTEHSSDTWIIHSNFNKTIKNMKIPLGVAGCDNRFHFEIIHNGFDPINEPFFITTHHHHASNIRNYQCKNSLNGNYLCMIPNLKPFKQYYQ
ncbi:hypothetical protein [uncultured Mediterranean phage]|nr:hypothetical protein [uncultured Mediterranean phage]